MTSRIALLGSGEAVQVLREDESGGNTLQVKSANGEKSVITKDDVIQIVEFAFTLKEVLIGLYQILKGLFSKKTDPLSNS